MISDQVLAGVPFRHCLSVYALHNASQSQEERDDTSEANATLTLLASLSMRDSEMFERDAAFIGR
jgi:hypothetical protein